MTEVPYGHYEEAYRAIHSALMSLTCPPPGRKLTKLGFTWNTDGTVATISAYDGTYLMFSLAFAWNSDGTLQQIVRS